MKKTYIKSYLRFISCPLVVLLNKRQDKAWKCPHALKDQRQFTRIILANVVRSFSCRRFESFIPIFPATVCDLLNIFKYRIISLQAISNIATKKRKWQMNLLNNMYVSFPFLCKKHVVQTSIDFPILIMWFIACFIF